jgi:hypothetical protein
MFGIKVPAHMDGFSLVGGKDTQLQESKEKPK